MTEQQAMQQAIRYFDSGEFQRLLARRVACATESQRADRDGELNHYLQQEIAPQLAALGFTLHFIDNPAAANAPFLVATRIEEATLPTLLLYGHGDVVFGDDENWRDGLNPWQLIEEGDRWYGRGSADNKGQHCVNLAALEQVYQARGGRLGFNCKILFEMGEEISSPGLASSRRCCAPTSLSPPTARASARRGRRCFSARAARPIFASPSARATTPITPATGAGCSAIPASSWRTPSPRWSMRAACCRSRR